MYGKIFESMYEGSMAGAGVEVFAVWGYIIAKVYDGVVEVHPVGVSKALGCTPAEVEKAVEYLKKPDPYSRRKDHEGRRLIHLADFMYEVPSAAYYRQLVREKDKRESARERQRRSRRDKSVTVTPLSRQSRKQKAESIKLLLLDYIYLSQDEVAKLQVKLGKEKSAEYIERLNEYIGSTGKEYKSHYHTILMWHRRDLSKQAIRATATKTKLFPIAGKTCYKKGCVLPAVYKSIGDYDSYYCSEHMPEDVKAVYAG